MNILHVVRGLANSSGLTHIVGPLAEAQARLGHHVEVFFVEKPNEEPVLPCETLVRSTEFPMSYKSRNYGYSRKLAKELRHRVSEFDIVHIHAIWNYVTWKAMKESLRAGVPYIVAPQGSLEDWALGRSRYAKSVYSRFFEKSLFDRAASMHVLTESEARQCKDFGIKAPMSILANGVDLPRIDSTAHEVTRLHEEFNFSPEQKVVLFLSRIFPKKGLDLLVDAFALVLKERSDVVLCIAGHDAGTGYLDEIKERVKGMDVESQVRYIGEVQGDRKFAVLRGADLFVLSSYSEGLPVAVVEAMATETAVVITPGCNISEVGTSDAGWIVETNAEAVSKGILESLASDGQRKQRAANARRLVEEKFNWASIASSSVSIYEKHSSPKACSPLLTNNESQQNNIPVTAIVLTKNEELNIKKCITALACFSEIVVVDSGSTDYTLEILHKEFPSVKILKNKFEDFGSQRNWAIDHSDPSNDWLLFVDADEFMEPELAEEIREVVGRKDSSIVGGFVAGRNYFLGRWLKRCTFYPSYQFRLFRKGDVRYRKEGHGQREVVEGETVYLKNSWRHEGFSQGIAHWIDRHNIYSTEEVELIGRLSNEPLKPFQVFRWDPIVRRRAIKRFASRVGGRPFFRFLYTYFWRLGFLDGYPGFLFCLLRVGQEIHITAKLAETRRSNENNK